MMTVLKYIEKKSERWFAIHPSLITLFLIAPYFRPFGISMFHSLWPIEVLGNLWGLGAFVLTMLLCMALRVRLGRVWWLFISVYALTAVSTLITGLTTLLPASLLHFVSASNLIDVVGMTGQALGLAAAVCLCATKTSWYRLFSILFYLLAAILACNTLLLMYAPHGLLSMDIVGVWHRADSPILFIGNRNFMYVWHLPLLASACALDALHNQHLCEQMASSRVERSSIAALVRQLYAEVPPVRPLTKPYLGVSVRTLATVVFGFYSVALAGSQTSLGALVLFTCLSLGILIYHDSAYKVFPAVLTKAWSALSNPWVHLGTYLVVSGGFVVFRIQNHQPFVYLINNLMGRSTTLTYRTEIWDAAMSLIGTPWYSFLIGHGHLSGPGMVDFFISHGFEHGYHVSEWVHVHNDLLQTLFSAGWLGIACSIAALLCSTYAFRQMREVAFVAIMQATACAFMVVMITETFMGTPALTFFVIGWFLFAESSRSSKAGC